MKAQSTYKKIVSVSFCVLLLTSCGKEPPPPPLSPAPSVPAGVRVFPGANKATIHWNNVVGATSYNVYYRATISGITKGNFSAKDSSLTSPFTVTGLTNGDPYVFVVTAVNAGGESDLSAEVSATPSDSIAIGLAAGENHTCALIASGIVKCWGANYAGQLGNGTNNSPSVSSSQPVEVAGITTAVAITAGRYHTCALLEDKRVQCWGEGASGQLGDGGSGPVSTPTPVVGMNTAVALSAGEEFTCAILSDGKAKCWGKNKAGQLGDGGTEPQPEPVDVNDIKKATMITAGYSHACADTQSTATSDRKTKCWGLNKSGQLGNNTVSDAINPVSVEDFIMQEAGMTTDDIATALTAGEHHTCAIMPDGGVNCWGSSEFGQLGNGTEGSKVKSKTPVRVNAIDTAREISAGENYTCALLLNNHVKCWGRNKAGQLGNGTTSDSPVPVLVPNLTARIIAAGENHTCTILMEGGVSCWGYNGFGQLGNGEFANADQPADVIGVGGAVAVAAGEDHSCALLDDGKIKCWGFNAFGQLGNGTFTSTSTPVDVSGTTTAKAIAAGGDHTCAILSNSRVACWGKNKDGQVGNGGQVHQNSPFSVLSIREAHEIAVGEDHTCAIHVLNAAKIVSCWGRNKSGQLGNGGQEDAFDPTPTQTANLAGPSKISAGGSHSCGLLSNTEMRCWGLNESGQIGDGTLNDIAVPKTVTSGLDPLSSVKAISTGEDHTCAILTNSSVYCWGKNLSGQVGTGETSKEESVPQLVQGIGSSVTVTAVSAGGDHTCVILDGTLKCWGDSEFGQRGDGTNKRSNRAADIQGMTNATAMATGENHTCAVIANDTVKCWGDNLHGQLGIGKVGFYATPVSVPGIPIP